MKAIASHALGLVRLSQWATAAVCLALLAGCGGGIYLDGASYGPPPEISLAVSPTVAQRGDPLQLVGAATASNGIDYVSFYRIDYGASVLLGTVTRPPIQWNTSVPVNAGSSVSFFAHVCDLDGFCRDSAVVTVAVYP